MEITCRTCGTSGEAPHRNALPGVGWAQRLQPGPPLDERWYFCPPCFDAEMAALRGMGQ